MFSCKSCEIFKNPYFGKHLRTTISVIRIVVFFDADITLVCFYIVIFPNTVADLALVFIVVFFALCFYYWITWYRCCFLAGLSLVVSVIILFFGTGVFLATILIVVLLGFAAFHYFYCCYNSYYYHFLYSLKQTGFTVCETSHMV